MKNIFYVFVVCVFMLTTSCSEWLDVNKDPDSPTEDVVKENVILPGIIATTSYELTGGFPARYVNAWVGQFALNGLAPDVQTFRIMDTDVNNTWEYTVYTNVLKNSKLMMEQAKANGNNYYLGIGEIITAYTLAISTDMWGDIPWSEALNATEFPKPKFDSQETVYTSIFAMLDDAILNLAYTGTQSIKPGSDDLLFGGDVAAWTKFAQTLKARYAMRLVYAKDAQTQADLALSSLDKGLTSNSDDADFSYFEKSGSENPWFQWNSKYNTLYLDTTTYIILNKYSDPRLDVFADTTFAEGMTGKFIPHRNGLLTTVSGQTSKLAIERETYDDGENVQPYFITKSTPVSFITYAEACFLKAEAYLWKGDRVNSFESLKKGTKASMEKLNMNSTIIDSYLASLPSLPADFEKAQEMIIELKYLANFLSVENYNDYRRTHYPSVIIPIGAQYSVVPYRLPYGTSTKLYNKDNVPDVKINEDKVWWDKK